MTDLDTRVLDDDLDESLASLVDTGDADPCPPPDDAVQASRMLRRMRLLQDRLAENEQVATVEVAAIAAWQEKVDAPIKRQYEWLEAAVEAWARAVHADDPSRKTISLPNGEVSIRARRPRVEVHATQDELRAVRTVHPGWVREKLEADKRALLDGMVPSTDPADCEAPEGFEAHYAVDPGDGEVWSGVVILLPTSKAVTVTPGPRS